MTRTWLVGAATVGSLEVSPDPPLQVPQPVVVFLPQTPRELVAPFLQDVVELAAWAVQIRTDRSDDEPRSPLMLLQA